VKDALVGIGAKVKSVDTLNGKGNLIMMMMMILNVDDKCF